MLAVAALPKPDTGSAREAAPAEPVTFVRRRVAIAAAAEVVLAPASFRAAFDADRRALAASVAS